MGTNCKVLLRFFASQIFFSGRMKHPGKDGLIRVHLSWAFLGFANSKILADGYIFQHICCLLSTRTEFIRSHTHLNTTHTHTHTVMTAHLASLLFFCWLEPNGVTATLMRINEAEGSLFMFALTEDRSILSS